MKIIIAPNSFKGSLNAFDTAKAIDAGLHKSRLTCETMQFPIADGGDHTVEVLNAWFKGDMIYGHVRGPLGSEVKAPWSVINGDTAVIEMARSSGISLVPEDQLNPLLANTYGTGQLIASALDRGVSKLIIGLGGSATVDAGTGILLALGAKLLDESGNEVGLDANPIVNLHRLDLSEVDSRMSALEIKVLCDVENPLLGDNGSAPVFGPQKGADTKMVDELSGHLTNFNQLVTEATGKDYGSEAYGGAAGGIAMMMMALFDAQIVNGIDYILDIMGYESAVRNCDLMITAEGKVDSQTLSGKGPHGVALKAREAGARTIVLAGKVEDYDALSEFFDMVLPITNGPSTLKEAMKSTATDLENTACQIGNLLAPSKQEFLKF